MNIRLLLLNLVALKAVSCTSDSPEKPSERGQLLSFTATETQSRLTPYVGQSIAFDDGEKVMSVIADRQADGTPKYKGVATWHYCASTKMLILDRLYFDASPNPWDVNWKDVAWDDASNNLITRAIPDGDYTLTDGTQVTYASGTPSATLSETQLEELYSKGFVELLRSDVVYQFYWIYPAIDMAQARQEFDAGQLDWPNALDSVPQGAFDQVIFPAVPSLDKDQNNNDMGAPNWRKHPLFVNLDQSTKTRINRSDFMTARNLVLTDGADITQANAQSKQPVLFRRKCAALQVIFDAHPTDSVIFTTAQGVMRGAQIDLAQDMITPYAPYTFTWPPMPEQSKYASTRATFIPYPVDATGNTLRLLLPPQQLKDLTLHFTLASGSYSLHLSDDLPALESNGLYLIRINRSGGVSIVINDWERPDDGSQIVVPVEEP